MTSSARLFFALKLFSVLGCVLMAGTSWLLIGSLLYLVGTFGVTIAFNVPLNDALANAKPDSVEGAHLIGLTGSGLCFGRAGILPE